MRTTVNVDDDVLAAVTALRQKSPMGLSEAINQLARAGIAEQSGRRVTEHFVQRTHSLGLRFDVSNVAELIERLEPYA